MKKTILSIIFIIMVISVNNVMTAYAEEEHCCSHGEIESEEIQTFAISNGEYNIVESKQINPSSTNTFPTYSSSLNLSNSKYFPIVGNQGGAGSCTTWATTYYQFTYQAARMMDWNAKDTKYVFSPKYPYNYLNNGSYKKGTNFYECYNFLSLNGSLRWADYPADVMNNYWYKGSDDTTTRNKLREALEIKVSKTYKYNITGYDNSNIIDNKDSYVVDYIKSILNSGKLVTFSTFSHGWSYVTMSNGQKGINYVIDNGDYSYNDDNKRSTHALTIVGYDDTVGYNLDGLNGIAGAEKGAFLVVNSWGTDWGNAGFIWVMYDAINEVSSVSRANVQNRIGAFEEGDFYSIEIAKSTPQLTAEVKISQTNRNDAEISLGMSETNIYSYSNADSKFDYFIDTELGDMNYDGTVGTSASRFFIIDFSSIYEGADKKYWLNVYNGEDAQYNTVVEYVRWYDSLGNEIKSFNTSDTIGSSGKAYNSSYAVQSISLDKTSETLYIGDESKLIPTIAPTNATNKKVSWTSSNNNVVEVDENGKVDAMGKGTATVTVVALDGSGKTASCVYTVKKAVSSIKINGFNEDLYIGETNQLSVTVSPSDASDTTVIWSSSNPDVVKVDNNGLVTCKGTGTAVVTAAARDGRGAFTQCTYAISDDFSSAGSRAYQVDLHDSIQAEIEYIYDTDVFKFTPSVTGSYTIFTEGNLDTYCFLYDDDDLIDYFAYDDDSGAGYNFAHTIDLIAGKTYYIEVMEFDDGVGEYTLKISENIVRVNVFNTNPDSRRVQMIGEASSLYDELKLIIGDETYTINKPTTGNYDGNFGDVRIKVTFEYKENETILVWNIDARITPTEVGGTDLVKFVFLTEDIAGICNTTFEIIAYKSTILTGVEAGSKLVDLVTELDSSDEYELTIRNWDNSTLVYTSTDSARTGLKIIKTDADNGRIVEIYYLVIYGDVTGGDQVGDGYVTSADQLAVLQDASKTKELTGVAALAADANHDGIVNASDALLISQCVAKLSEIDQDYEITVVPDDCYYLDPVAF